MSDLTVTSRTQLITVNKASSTASVSYAGPVGPGGPIGEVTTAQLTAGLALKLDSADFDTNAAAFHANDLWVWDFDNIQHRSDWFDLGSGPGVLTVTTSGLDAAKQCYEYILPELSTDPGEFDYRTNYQYFDLGFIRDPADFGVVAGDVLEFTLLQGAKVTNNLDVPDEPFDVDGSQPDAIKRGQTFASQFRVSTNENGLSVGQYYNYMSDWQWAGYSAFSYPTVSKVITAPLTAAQLTSSLYVGTPVDIFWDGGLGVSFYAGNWDSVTHVHQFYGATMKIHRFSLGQDPSTV